MKATIKAAELLPALSMTIPHSATDTTIPDLYGVQFTVDSHVLEVFACDRFTLGVYTLPLGPDDESKDGVFTLPLPDTKDWLKIARSASDRRANPDVTITALFDEAHVGTATLEHPGGLAQVKVTTPGKPMHWNRLVTDPAKAGFGPAAFGVNPKHLAKFTKAHKGYLRVQLPADPAKTLRIFDTTDDRFFGLIMPVRLTKEEDQ